jgi:hypothetical protein
VRPLAVLVRLPGPGVCACGMAQRGTGTEWTCARAGCECERVHACVALPQPVEGGGPVRDGEAAGGEVGEGPSGDGAGGEEASATPGPVPDTPLAIELQKVGGCLTACHAPCVCV